MKNSLRCRAVSIALMFGLALAPIYAQQSLNPPLKNWAAPLYWAPSPAEAEQQRVEQRVAHPDAAALAQAVSIFTAPGPMTFIAITPCRVLDTRGAPYTPTGAFGPPSYPSLAAGVALSVPMPSSSNCSIPSNAGAYSLNITVVPPGPLSYLSVWPAGAPYPGVSTLNDPIAGGVIANAAIVVAGTSGAIQMVAGNPTNVIIDVNGYYATPTDGSFNTAIGLGALANNTTGDGNTASGNVALFSNTDGSYNTASGDDALGNNTSGSFNTADGYQALGNSSAGSNNTASGYDALRNNTGSDNTASGAFALQGVFPSTGSNNTAIGYWALLSNTTGSTNTASGISALGGNTTGSNNTATGGSALYSSTTGSDNTANGEGALFFNTTGGDNTAVGYWALLNDTTGGNNIAVGYSAAQNVSGGNSNSIYVGSLGTGTDASGTIRIGTVGTQTSAYIAGIYGGTPGAPNLLVCVDANGTLGTTGCGNTPSSGRFKERIADMGDSSSKLLQLRPVTFFYKPQYDDGSHSLQYGLIAEEVAKLYPDMVGYDKEGRPASVKYQSLTPMLLNEVQKQNAQIRSLEDRLAALEALVSAGQ